MKSRRVVRWKERDENWHNIKCVKAWGLKSKTKLILPEIHFLVSDSSCIKTKRWMYRDCNWNNCCCCCCWFFFRWSRNFDSNRCNRCTNFYYRIFASSKSYLLFLQAMLKYTLSHWNRIQLRTQHGESEMNRVSVEQTKIHKPKWIDSMKCAFFVPVFRNYNDITLLPLSRPPSPTRQIEEENVTENKKYCNKMCCNWKTCEREIKSLTLPFALSISISLS